MRSSRTGAAAKPPPRGELAHERAEHLRHRARSANYRARADRNMQRLARERLQTRHDRTRLHLLEERLAATGPREWLAWRLRQAGRVLPVLFEKRGRHEGQLIGRSPYLQAVHATAPDRLIGQIVPVRIESSARNSLAGVMELETA